MRHDRALRADSGCRDRRAHHRPYWGIPAIIARSRSSSPSGAAYSGWLRKTPWSDGPPRWGRTACAAAGRSARGPDGRCRRAGPVEQSGVHGPTDLEGTPAARLFGDQAAGSLHERSHPPPCPREPLPEGCRLDPEHPAPFLAGEVDMSSRMKTRRCSRSRHASIICVQPSLTSSSRIRRSPSLEADVLRLPSPTLRREQVIGGDPPHPGPETAPAPEGPQPGHDLDEDLLRGVLGIGGVAQHAHGEVVDVVPRCPDEVLAGPRIALKGPCREIQILEHGGLRVHPTGTAGRTIPSWLAIPRVSSFTHPSTILPSRTR